MRIKYNKSVIKEALYSEQYCDICGDFKNTVELKVDDQIEPEEVFYVAICKNDLKELLKNFNKFEEQK